MRGKNYGGNINPPAVLREGYREVVMLCTNTTQSKAARERTHRQVCVCWNVTLCAKCRTSTEKEHPLRGKKVAF